MRAVFLAAFLTTGSAAAQPSADPMAVDFSGADSASNAPESPNAETGASAWLGLGVYGSLLTDRLDRSNISIRTGLILSAGVRWDRFGLFGMVERNLWLQTERELRFGTGVVNVGVGGEYFYANGRMRLGLAVGMSVLVEDQLLDPAPSYGLFGDLRPTGLRWSRGTWWTVQVDPIGFTIVAPVLREPRLFEVQYRFTVTLEWQSKGGRRSLD